ncbi:MAG: hypothetical protein EOO38_22415 [Cytophagaceae bacterium]|nr:MAG: hypothetical protein EOO38_22415 [Cytophagaceae bacterium]
MRDGWDGPGSVRPSEGSIQGALEFVDSLPPQAYPPEVTAAGDGEISLSWREPGKFVDVSFFGKSASAYSRVGDMVKKQRSLQKFSELPIEAIRAVSIA